MTKKDTPLITNGELNSLLRRAKGMSDSDRDTMYEVLVYVRGTYERRIAELEAANDKFKLAAQILRDAGL